MRYLALMMAVVLFSYSRWGLPRIYERGGCQVGMETASNASIITTTQRSSTQSVDALQTEEKVPEYLVSVPFYVYEEISWINTTISGIGNVANFNPNSEGGSSSSSLRWKHGDDYWFLKAALEHPMRTTNISEAKLFFVPTLLNHYDSFHLKDRRSFCANVINGSQLCDRELLQVTKEFLQKSESFQSYPERHSVVRSHWMVRKNDNTRASDQLYKEFFLEMLPQMNIVNFEQRQIPTLQHNRPSYYVGTPCNGGVITNKTLDFAMIANMKFEPRRRVCKWLANAASYSILDLKVVCGTGDRCPALAQAKYGLHVVGDTWGSQRLMDILVSGTVPIITHMTQMEVQGGWIDWKQLSYYIPIHASDHFPSRQAKKWHKGNFQMNDDNEEGKFLERIQRVMNDHVGYEQRQKAVLEHIPFFDMATLYPFDTYFYLLQAELYPETRHPRSRWSALIMPPVRYTEPP